MTADDGGCNRRATVASQIATSHSIAATSERRRFVLRRRGGRGGRFVVAGRRDRSPPTPPSPPVFNVSVTRPAIIRSDTVPGGLGLPSGWAETADRDIKCRSFCPSNGDIRFPPIIRGIVPDYVARARPGGRALWNVCGGVGTMNAGVTSQMSLNLLTRWFPVDTKQMQNQRLLRIIALVFVRFALSASDQM